MQNFKIERLTTLIEINKKPTSDPKFNTELTGPPPPTKTTPSTKDDPATRNVLAYGVLYFGWPRAKICGNTRSRPILNNRREIAACATNASAIPHASTVAIAVVTPSQ